MPDFAVYAQVPDILYCRGNRMVQLALLRHGESEWNLANRFTGWVDVDLTSRGCTQARQAGALLRETGIAFSGCFTSVQKRAIRTLWIALDEMDCMWLPVTRAWQLNERHYGALTGLDKAETVSRYGADQVKIWRRSYGTPPPPADTSPDAYGVDRDRRYELYDAVVPSGESLKTTLGRVAPYFRHTVVPLLKKGSSLIVSAHGNSLRALVKILLDVPDDDISGLEIPTGNPLLFDLDPASLHSRAVRYLDAERAQSLPPLPGDGYSPA